MSWCKNPGGGRRAGAGREVRALMTALSVPAAASLIVAVAACGKTSTQSAEPESRRDSPVAAPAAQSGAVQPASLQRELPASDRFSESAFELEFKTVGAAVSGKPSQAEALLTAKAPYHVNAEYPLKFTLEASPGVSYPKPVVRKESAKLEEMRAIVPVEFVPQGAGKKRVAGLLAFSVCNDERCLLEKRQLELAVDVK